MIAPSPHRPTRSTGELLPGALGRTARTLPPPSPAGTAAGTAGRRRLSRMVAAGALVGLTLGLSGCWQGQNAATYQQAAQGATGDGVEANSTDNTVGIRGAIIIADHGDYSLVVTLVNRTARADSLIAVDVAGGQTMALGNGIDLPGDSTVTVGQASATQHIFGTGLNSAASAFIPVRLLFRNGGIIDTRLLVRSPEGIWSHIAVRPTTARTATPM